MQLSILYVTIRCMNRYTRAFALEIIKQVVFLRNEYE